MQIRKITFLTLSILFSVCIIQLLKLHPDWIERFYSKLIYPYLFRSKAWFFDSIPFSIGDVIYLTLGSLLAYNLGLTIKKKEFALTFLLLGLGIVYITFQLNWGLNYYRIPLSEQFNVKKEYSINELEDLTLYFVNESNKIHRQLVTNDSIEVVFSGEKNNLLSVFDNYKKKQKIHLKAKFSQFSVPLTYMGFSGYLNPFTLEAHVNELIPAINLPITIAHEMAHQKGYAAENEANFMGFIQANQHPDLFIQYSAILFGFRYCYNSLYNENPEKAAEILNQLNSGIVKNLKTSNLFWKKYQNPIEPYFKSTYDQFLKANGQTKGIRSYNEVISLLIHWKKNEFKLVMS